MADLQQTERTRVKRAHQRGRYDRETIYGILDKTILCNVGYVFDEHPYVTPTFHWRDGDRIYWHGSSASRMMKQLREGVRACLTVTHFDGVILARSAFHHSANYRSAMVLGTPSIVDDPEEKMASLKRFMEVMMPGRWDDVRAPNDQEMKATMVLTMPIDEASAKVNDAFPGEEEEDYELNCWAGVLPIRTVVGEPVDDPKLRTGITPPEYLRGFSMGYADV